MQYPKPDEVAPVARLEPVAVGAPRVGQIEVPGPTAKHTALEVVAAGIA